MKFAPFIYEYIVSDDWEFLEYVPEDLKEYFGFDVPFTRDDLNNENWENSKKYLEDWVAEHKLKVIETETDYVDLEKSYEEIKVVFSFEGKYYETTYIYSLYVTPFEYGYPKDSKEVFPHTKTVTVTEYY